MVMKILRWLDDWIDLVVWFVVAAAMIALIINAIQSIGLR